MEKIEIQFTLFSAFYAPLIAVMEAGFLEEEGIDATWSISPPGVSAIEALKAGTAHVIQTAPSQAFSELSAGKNPRLCTLLKLMRWMVFSFLVGSMIQNLIGKN